MAISTVEFAEGWERWKKDKEFADTSPQAYSDYLESQHAVAQVEAIRRVFARLNDYADKANAYLDIETIVATEYGDEWVSTFLIPIPEVKTEWPTDDDPDYVID